MRAVNDWMGDEVIEFDEHDLAKDLA